MNKNYLTVSVGQRLKHKLTNSIYIIHSIDDYGRIEAISNVAIASKDLYGWVRVTPGHPHVELLMPSSIKTLQIGNFIRKETEGNAYIVSAIASDIVFANRLLHLSHPEEWIVISN